MFSLEYTHADMELLMGTTGKSITELELDEAEGSLSAGNLAGILLYWLAMLSGRRLCVRRKQQPSKGYQP